MFPIWPTVLQFPSGSPIKSAQILFSFWDQSRLAKVWLSLNHHSVFLCDQLCGANWKHLNVSSQLPASLLLNISTLRYGLLEMLGSGFLEKMWYKSWRCGFVKKRTFTEVWWRQISDLVDLNNQAGYIRKKLKLFIMRTKDFHIYFLLSSHWRRTRELTNQEYSFSLFLFFFFERLWNEFLFMMQ